MLINNAGFGVFGKFYETDLNNEIEMINTNLVAVHLLTKLFLRDMVKKDSGYILNVASSAAFGPGPLMATYYATKAYVNNLTEAINEELKRDNSNVVVCSLCPGPVDTNFNNVAGVHFGVKALSSSYVAEYTINQMFKNKEIIIPGLMIRALRIVNKIAPSSWVLEGTYNTQKGKMKQGFTLKIINKCLNKRNYAMASDNF